ncbi:DUF6264 family protein [Leifsonia virtsii]|uniref:DUF6264 family protein n=1 Tax=Leifsonia virtsii TaxID=3035915 RepID=A0ABT8IWZ7_9MICO|nr:DUF6264 family protein [Leifsonia virtsii]MDN4596926.1 DUF6264 family protein [Leifsonia virtsii]
MTTPPPAYGPPAPGYAPPPVPRRPVVVWDLVTTIVLLVIGGAIAIGLTFFAFFLVFASDPCGASTVCDTDRMSAGFFTALLGPGAVTVAAVIVAVVLLIRRRIAFWVPLVGIVLAIGVWIGGAALVISGVPGASL